MKCVITAIKQSNLSKNNKLETLSACKCLALGYLNSDLVLIYANGDTLEFYNSNENLLNAVYADFINQLVSCKEKPKPNLALLDV